MTGKQKTVCRGFTLIELSIVLGIIGVLLGAIWSAASAAYTNHTTEDLIKQIQFFQQHVRTLFTSTSLTDAAGGSGSYNFSQDEALTDSCSGGQPCSTNMLMQAGAFLPDFIAPGVLISGSSYGTGNLHVTKFGYPIWTGVENSQLYAQQEGQCGQGTDSSPDCDSGSTVIELDLLNLSSTTCTALLMGMVNAKIDGLDGISTSLNGWGPEIASYFGNATLPASMSLSTAAAACSSGAGAFSYDTINTPQLWMWFTNS